MRDEYLEWLQNYRIQRRLICMENKTCIFKTWLVETLGKKKLEKLLLHSLLFHPEKVSGKYGSISVARRQDH